MPLPWQPGVMMIGSVVGLLLVVTCFRYRLYLPFLFRLEPGNRDCEKCKENIIKSDQAENKQLELGDGVFRGNKPHWKRGKKVAKENPKDLKFEDDRFERKNQHGKRLQLLEFKDGNKERNKPWLKRGKEAVKENPKDLKIEGRFKQMKSYKTEPAHLEFGNGDGAKAENTIESANKGKDNGFRRQKQPNFPDRELQPNGACKYDANRGKLDLLKKSGETCGEPYESYETYLSHLSTYDNHDMLDVSVSEELSPPTAEGLSLYERMNVSCYGYGK